MEASSKRLLLARASSTGATLATAILISVLITSGALPTAGQSAKGQAQQQVSANNRPSSSYSSPASQARQQQQLLPATTTTNRPTGSKRRPSNQQPSYQQREEQQQQERLPAATEDPLSDSEPALYGSVAGQPGVDFPAYTRIPKTSFSCENKGFDFGFYADEETGCQAYHVCWSGRHESFLCGVGTVFNQAILACDYWHSVDCSKSSQFYSVNAELGKAGAEPASGGAQRQQARAPVQNQNQNSFGEPLNQNQNQRRNQPQQQQYATGSEEAGNEQVREEPAFGTKAPVERRPQPVSQQRESGYGTTFAPQRAQSFDYQQRIVHSSPANEPTVKSPPARQQPPPTTTLATPLGVKRAQPATGSGSSSSQRFNMDLNQKVNSLIESPVRAPLKPAAAAKQRQQQQQRQQPSNFAQMAVARAQQTGSQQNSGRKGFQQPQPQQPQQQRSYEPELDEPQQQQQQQQQNFDDAPVQTSTAQTTQGYGTGSGFGTSPRSTNNNAFDVPQSQQTVIRAGNGLDGSSAITTQYDTLKAPAANQDNNNNNNYGNYGNNNAGGDSAYESNIDEPNGSANDDFRSAGAKAAASHNQNWYIMRTI